MKDYIEINGNKFTDIDKAKDYFEKQVRIIKTNKEIEFNKALKIVCDVKREIYGDDALMFYTNGVQIIIT